MTPTVYYSGTAGDHPYLQTQIHTTTHGRWRPFIQSHSGGTIGRPNYGRTKHNDKRLLGDSARSRLTAESTLTHLSTHTQDDDVHTFAALVSFRTGAKLTCQRRGHAQHTDISKTFPHPQKHIPTFSYIPLPYSFIMLWTSNKNFDTHSSHKRI